MKRIVSLFLCAVLVMGMLPSIALAATTVASGTCGANLTWVLDSDGLLTISGSGDMEDYAYYSNSPWASRNSEITSININSGVNSIGNNAFASCGNLTDITIAGTVTSIGDGAFSWCDVLNSVVIPDSVVTIGDDAFYDCNGLTSINISGNVTAIGIGAFATCDALTGIWVDSANRFYSNDSQGVLYNKDKTSLMQAPGMISEYVIPDGVTNIGARAFMGCESLSEVTLSQNVKSIGVQAFHSCSSLESIVIPDSVTLIDDSAFYWCTTLTSISIPDSVLTLGDSVFSQCYALTSANIGCGVTSMGIGIFTDCSSLNAIFVDDDNSYYCNDIRGVLYDKNKTIVIQAPGALSGSYSIPDSVVTIGRSAFSGCSELTTITIPKSVKTISGGAFGDCVNLTSVNIPDGVVTIGFSAFFNCNKLASVTIPNSVNVIESRAFMGCPSLASITIPKSVSSIGDDAFFFCTSLTEIEFKGSAPVFGEDVFRLVTATAYYHGSNTTWTSDVLQDYGGTITWQSVSCTREAIPAVAATCTETGLTTGNACSVCGQVFTAQTIIPALGHDWNAATCTSPKTCKRCYTTSGSALGHDWLDATCTAPKTCSICGETSGSALGHSWSAATCTEPKTCTKCNVTSGTALGHSWNAATCTNPKTCSRCSLTSGNALGHNWDAGTVTKQPTESETGIKTYQCTRCTEAKTETIPALVHTHSYTSVVTNPTCTQQGYTTYTCACGDTYKSNYTPALNHSFVDGICTRCGEGDPTQPGPVANGVSRIAGANRYKTSMGIADALKEKLGISRFSNIVVASAMNFPDALAGSYLAAVKDAPILLTYNGYHSEILSYIKSNLTSDGTVYILGGQGAVPPAFTDMLTQSSINWVRVAGNDRFGTNLEILTTAGVAPGQSILVCTGYGFADSLSVSATGLPILLVGESLNQAQKDFLKEAGGGKFWIVGGAGAVSPAVEAELKTYASEVERLAGADRHDTSVLVADTFFPEGAGAVVAYSMNFPDGLCGGPLAYSMNVPLILTNSSNIRVNAYTDPRSISTGYVLGGISLISDAAARRIFHLAADASITQK